jgi:hypothetical protein
MRRPVPVKQLFYLLYVQLRRICSSVWLHNGVNRMNTAPAFSSPYVLGPSRDVRYRLRFLFRLRSILYFFSSMNRVGGLRVVREKAKTERRQRRAVSGLSSNSASQYAGAAWMLAVVTRMAKNQTCFLLFFSSSLVDKNRGVFRRCLAHCCGQCSVVHFTFRCYAQRRPLVSAAMVALPRPWPVLL